MELQTYTKTEATALEAWLAPRMADDAKRCVFFNTKYYKTERPRSGRPVGSGADKGAAAFAVVADNEGLSTARLAAVAGISTKVMMDRLKRLEARGLISSEIVRNNRIWSLPKL